MKLAKTQEIRILTEILIEQAATRDTVALIWHGILHTELDPFPQLFCFAQIILFLIPRIKYVPRRWLGRFSPWLLSKYCSVSKIDFEDHPDYTVGILVVFGGQEESYLYILLCSQPNSLQKNLLAYTKISLSN